MRKTNVKGCFHKIKRQSWYDFADYKMPEELKEKLKQLKLDSEANAYYEKLAASYKKIYLEWVTSAKRVETKLKRINEMVEKLKEGYKNPYAK